MERKPLKSNPVDNRSPTSPSQAPTEGGEQCNLAFTPPDSAWPVPTELAQAGSKRLGIAALVWAGLWSLAVFLNAVVAPLISPDRPLDDAWPIPGAPVAAVVILLSLGIFAYTRHVACDCFTTLHLGLVYELCLAFAIGFVNQWTPNTVGISWIAVLILIHPMIVPHRPRWTLVAALLAASMDLVGLGITKARGVPVPTSPEVLWYVLPSYICALLAVLPSHIVARLGRDVRKARDAGSYRLGDLLGKGGMGEVYDARHRMLRRPAAVKLIRPHALGANGRDSGTAVQRFRREAEVVANLHSPHTIVLYDFGVTPVGDFYYVMERLQGLDFESLVRKFGPVRPARVAHLIRQTCHSLAEAHHYKLVHRDIKPSNLFACRVGLETDFVKVLDFGLVKGRFDDGGDRARLTAPDMTTGTPAYMAPEIARGQEVDRRADIYALGCVAFWLLTGRLVFQAETPTAMILAHVERQPEPPSQVSEFAVSKDFDDVVLACLEKDPSHRPQSAEDLAQRLAHCDVGRPWTQQSADRWWEENVPDLETAPVAGVPQS